MGWWQERTRTLATRILDLLGIEPLQETSQAPYRVGNDCVRSISHLVAQDGSGSRLVSCDEVGRLVTAPVGHQGLPLDQASDGRLSVIITDNGLPPFAAYAWPGNVFGVGNIRETKLPAVHTTINESVSDELDINPPGLYLVEAQLYHSGTDDWASVGTRASSGGANNKFYEVSKGQIVYWVGLERYLYLDSTTGDAECVVRVWDLS